jgi:hypothetical protein
LHKRRKTQRKPHVARSNTQHGAIRRCCETAPRHNTRSRRTGRICR